MIVKGTFEKARIYIESHSDLSRDSEHYKIKPGPCITISRETGAGADVVSELLLEFFKPFKTTNPQPWTIFDKNLIEKVLEDHHLPHKLSQYMVEDKISDIKSDLNDLLGIHPPAWMLVRNTAKTILQLAHLGNVIIVGRAGNVVTASLQNVFHVRLVSSIDAKVKHVMQIYDYNRKEASDFIKQEDQARRNYFTKYFSKLVDNPELYHLILNTGLLGYEETAKIIGNSVLRKFHDLFKIYDEAEYF